MGQYIQYTGSFNHTISAIRISPEGQGYMRLVFSRLRRGLHKLTVISAKQGQVLISALCGGILKWLDFLTVVATSLHERKSESC